MSDSVTGGAPGWLAWWPVVGVPLLGLAAIALGVQNAATARSVSMLREEVAALHGQVTKLERTVGTARIGAAAASMNKSARSKRPTRPLPPVDGEPAADGAAPKAKAKAKAKAARPAGAEGEAAPRRAARKKAAGPGKAAKAGKKKHKKGKRPPGVAP